MNDGPLKKKERQQLKHQALLQRKSLPHSPCTLTGCFAGLGGTTSSPYSKSHMRRLRRRQHETLSADLTAVNEVITAIEREENKTQVIQGQIGEGKGLGLSQHQRKRTLYDIHSYIYAFPPHLNHLSSEAENLRYKRVIQDTQFVANPFHAIRTHVQNTLVKHQPQT